MSRATGVARRLTLGALSGLVLGAMLGLSCGDGAKIVPDSRPPSKTTETVTGANGGCTPLVCPESSPFCPEGLHCFEGACLDANCKPACQYGSSGVIETVDGGNASLDAGSSGGDGGAGGLVTPCSIVCGSGGCSNGCTLGGSVYAPGDLQPSNQCVVCLIGGTWSNVSAGTACSSGVACVSGETCDGAGNCGGGGPTCGAPDTCCPTANPVCVNTATDPANCGSCGNVCPLGDVCTLSVCTGGCTIAGTSYAPGQSNPANACQVCNPPISNTAWSNVAAGTACANGICLGGACTPVCLISGNIYITGAVNPANGCQSCQPSVFVNTWTNDPDGTQNASCTVASKKICVAGACTSACEIGGTSYAAAAVNPANPCQVCTPATSVSAWTNLAGGSGCGAGLICNAGAACVADCKIGGNYYANGAVNAGNDCQTCVSTTSTTAWTNDAEGTACAAGKICNATGNCSSDCLIGGVLYTSGTANPADPCQVCTPTTSTIAWSNKAGGTACGGGNVCDGAGNCANDCFIGGVAYAAGTPDPVNACELCKPTTSTSAWSFEPSGLACAASKVCNATGTCSSDCFIGGTLYASGATNPGNPCQVCTPTTSTVAWSDKAAGSGGCAAGTVCNGAGACASDCFVGGVLYAAGAVNPANVCQACTPASSTIAFTNNAAAEGNSCAAGKICNAAGACLSECFIGGTLYGPGVANPVAPCQICTPATSTNTWSDAAAGAAPCGAGLVCDGAGNCAADCFITGVLYPGGTPKPGNVCEECTPASSTIAWSNTPAASVTTCAAQMICNGAGVCAADCYIGGVLYTNGTADPANKCLECTSATSNTVWSDEPVGHSCAPGGVTHLCNGAGVCN